MSEKETKVASGFEPTSVDEIEVERRPRMYRKGQIGGGFPGVCPGQLHHVIRRLSSGHVPGAVVTVTAPVPAVDLPDHAAPLLGLQTTLRVPDSSI